MTHTDNCSEVAISRSATAATTVIDRNTDAADIVTLTFTRSTLDRQHAFVRSFRIDGPVAATDLLPEGTTVDRCATHNSGVTVLAHNEQGSVLITGLPRATTVSVAAPSDGAAAALEAVIRCRAPEATLAGHVLLRTWHSNSHGQYRSADRSIAAPTWATIEANYASPTRHRLEQLMSLTRPLDGGKLILWHGDPGTGKTTALRALMREWAPWCASQYIADPERLFADPGYISEVLTRPMFAAGGPTHDTAGDPDTRWRLIVAEDSDEYLRTSARRDAGAGLGRLLNLTDGVLGQGFNTLILLTTNEELNRIHPALTRPGRCLARIEFTRFSPAEARRWLPDECDLPDQELTLAELCEHAGSLDRIGGHMTSQHAIGQYL